MATTLFSGATVYSGGLDAPASADILVTDGRITAVGAGLTADSVVDCTGKWISPGFFDCHVHVMVNGFDVMRNLATPFSKNFYLAERNLRTLLGIGITSVRDAGGADLGVKEAVDDGLIAGPRMQIAISMLSQTGGHGDSWEVCGAHLPHFATHPGRPSNIADGPDEVRRKVREMLRAGASVIKVATSGGVLSPRDDPKHGHFRDDEIEMMVNEATAAGVFVMAHAQATEGIKAAIRNGVRSIEHGIYLDDEAISMMIDADAYLVPTLHAPRAVVAAADAGAQIPAASVQKARDVIDAHNESFQKAHQAGVKIAMGTDCGVGPHGTNLDELELMAGLGASALETLHYTTGAAAALLGVHEDRGTIAVGQRADLVVLTGTPGDITGLADRVHSVYQDGVKVADGAAAGE